jgi:extradiol dioxygenase family protein
MALALTRAPSQLGPQASLFGAEHFQMAYATNDIERACAIFSERYGIREFRRLEGPLDAGGQIRVELVWVGSIMYELVTASGPGSDIYISRLPRDGFAIKHHHLGYLIRDDAEWDALMQKVERDGWSMPHQRANPGFLKSCFVEAPELGHYLEYICPEPAGLAFFESVPRA